MDGRSLIPVAKHPAVDAGRELLDRGADFKAIRTERYMYAEYDTGEEGALRPAERPFELQSLHDDPAYAAVKDELAKRLHALQDCLGASCRVYQPDPPSP